MMARYGSAFITISRKRNVNLKNLKKGLHEEVSNAIRQDVHELAINVVEIIKKFLKDVRDKESGQRSSPHSAKSLSRRARLHDHVPEYKITPQKKSRTSGGKVFEYTDYVCEIRVRPPSDRPEYNIWDLMDKGQNRPRISINKPMVFFKPIYLSLGSDGIIPNHLDITSGLAIAYRKTGASKLQHAYKIGKRGKKIRNWDNFTITRKAGPIRPYYLYRRAIYELTNYQHIKGLPMTNGKLSYQVKTGYALRKARYFSGKSLTYKLEVGETYG